MKIKVLFRRLLLIMKRKRIKIKVQLQSLFNIFFFQYITLNDNESYTKAYTGHAAGPVVRGQAMTSTAQN